MTTAINIVSAIRGVYLVIDFVNHDNGTGWDENLVKLHLRARFTKAHEWHNQSKYISVHRLQHYPEPERESLRSFRKVLLLRLIKEFEMKPFLAILLGGLLSAMSVWAAQSFEASSLVTAVSACIGGAAGTIIGQKLLGVT
jgi:hypothetical protein